MCKFKTFKNEFLKEKISKFNTIIKIKECLQKVDIIIKN